jgi:adenylyltransferase/sulfurtransferase
MDKIILDRDERLRYSRQMILNEIGMDGQEKLLKAKVLVIGTGGLGSPCLYYLAGAGIGTLGIADFDTVDISNVHRQIIHFSDDIGKKKVDSAEEKLLKINPKVNITKYPFRLNIDNIQSIIEEYDVVVDAVDNFPARYLISDCCYFLNKPLIEGAAIGFDGIAMTILPGKTPCYRCLYPMPPADGTIPSCADTGILGMVTGVIGSIQALETVKVILQIGQILDGRLLTFDGLGLNFMEIKIDKNIDCPLCGKEPTITELVQYEIKCKTKKIDVSDL